MQKIDIHNTEKKHAVSKKKFLEDDTILLSNRKKLIKFLDDSAIGKTARMKAAVKTCNLRSREKYLYNLKPFITFFAKKEITTLTVKDIETFVAALDNGKIKTLNYKTEYSSKTKSDIKKTMIIFIRWLFGERSKKYHEMTFWVSTRHDKKSVASLEESQIKQILNNCTDLKQKALIACLFDGGFRIEEFLNIRNVDVREVQSDAPYYKMMVRNQFSKTQGRDVSMLWSESYDIIKALIVSKGSNRNPEEPFFDGSYRYCQELLKKLGGKIGVRLHAHLFRHSSATYYANKSWNEFQLNKRYGWGRGSDMGREYVDMSKIDEQPKVKEYEESKLADLRNKLRKQEEENRLRKEEIESIKQQHEERLKHMEKRFHAYVRKMSIMEQKAQ